MVEFLLFRVLVFIPMQMYRTVQFVSDGAASNRK
ncbi:hypothetical protein BGLA2_350029 [Burkholderia gladioli]|nr:hypothetical protein BGLA2_350029 [Burkholderia gladioli]